MRTTMTVTEVETDRTITRSELRVYQSSSVHFRQHLAHLHLLAAAAEAATPCDEQWTISISEGKDQGILAIELAEGTAAEAGRATSTLHGLARKLQARGPRFPLPGARDALPSPFVGYELTTLVTGLMVPQLQVTPPGRILPRQLHIVLHLLAAAVELATPHTEQWMVDLRNSGHAPPAVQIDLIEWSADRANRAMAVLDHVVARCFGAPMNSRDRFAATLIQQVWPAIANHAWAAPVALQLWT